MHSVPVFAALVSLVQKTACHYLKLIRNFYLRAIYIINQEIGSVGSIRVVLAELLLSDPGDALAFVPSAVTLLSLLVEVDADSLLLAVHPLALVLSTIGPLEDADTLLLVVDIVALVVAAIGPGEAAATMHLVDLPAAAVLATVGPLVSAEAMDVVVLEVAGVL